MRKLMFFLPLVCPRKYPLAWKGPVAPKRRPFSAAVHLGQFVQFQTAPLEVMQAQNAILAGGVVTQRPERQQPL